MPEGLITELNAVEKKDHKSTDRFKDLDMNYYHQEFIKKQEDLRNASYSLASITGLALELLFGKKSTKYAKNNPFYEIYTINLNLGTYSFNIEMINLNYLVELINHLSNTMLTSQISDYRPFIKPITKIETETIKQRLASKHETDDYGSLDHLRRCVVQDYFRLLLFTNIYRKYGHLTNIDVKKRLIWTFKRSSILYKLIYAKTPADIAKDEAKYIDNEHIYMDKMAAFNMNKRINSENDEYHDYMRKSGQNNGKTNDLHKIAYTIKKHFGIVFDDDICMKVTFSVNMSLLKIKSLKSSDPHDIKEKQIFVKEIDMNINDIVIEYAKAGGLFESRVNVEIKSIDVGFRDKRIDYDKSSQFKMQSLDEYIHSPESLSP